MIFDIHLSSQALAEDHDLLRYAHTLQLMANRMSVSHFKHGEMSSHYPHSSHGIDNLHKRLEMYEKDGNVEWLLDVANFAVIEFLFPSHERSHFENGDETVVSPGLIYRNEDDK